MVSTNLAHDNFYEHALKIRRNSIYAITGVLAMIFAAEVLVDFDNTTVELCILFLVPNLVLSLYARQGNYQLWIGHTQVLLIYLIIQLHFFYNPKFFNVLVYWMPFIPLVTVFLISIRFSFIWLGITIATLVFNIAYGEHTIGVNYLVTPRFRAFGAAGVVFVIGLFLAYLFLYRLLTGYYLSVRQKQDEIKRLNSELKELNENLEKKVEDKVADIKSQNERLEKYAFMNAHVVRAPLANIVGAMDLYNQIEDPDTRKELLEMVEESASRLDQAVHEVALDLSHKPD